MFNIHKICIYYCMHLQYQNFREGFFLMVKRCNDTQKIFSVKQKNQPNQLCDQIDPTILSHKSVNTSATVSNLYV